MHHTDQKPFQKDIKTQAPLFNRTINLTNNLDKIEEAISILMVITIVYFMKIETKFKNSFDLPDVISSCAKNIK